MVALLSSLWFYIMMYSAMPVKDPLMAPNFGLKEDDRINLAGHPFPTEAE